MPDLYFRGDALPVAEIKTLVVGGTPANLQVYTATMNGKSIAYTASGVDTNDTIGAALLALLTDTGSTPPEFQEASYTGGLATITATGTEAGRPYTITTGATGTGTFVTTTTTAATGPNFWNLGANWSTGSAPANGDSVYIRQSAVDILYGLDNNAVTLALLDIDASYTGKIGLNEFSASGYAEYREQYLKISATTAFCGRGFGTGPGRFRWNAGSNVTTFSVYSTGSPDNGVVAAIDFVGTNANNVINVNRGTFAVGRKPGTASTVLAMSIGTQDGSTSNASVYTGYNVTLGTVSMTGGTIDVWNGATTVTLDGGTLNANKGAFGTITNNDGVVNYDTNGTCGTYVGGTGSLLDCSRVIAARTFTTASLLAKSSFRDPAKTITFGGSGLYIGCKIEELTEFDIGENFFLQRA